MTAPPPEPTLPRPSRAARLAHGVRRAVLRRRRVLAALLVAVAVVAGLRSVAAPPPATVAVPVATRDVPAGAVLRADDLRIVAAPPDLVPPSVVDSPVGRRLAGALGAGEPVTAARLVGPGLTDGLSGVVALPVRLPDAGAVALLEVGDEVDLLGADPRGTGVETLTTGAQVLALPPSDAETATGPTGLPGRLVVMGVTSTEVDGLVAASVASVLTYTWTNR